MKYLYKLAIILTVILTLNACKSNNNVVDVIDGIENDIQVKLWEKLGENDSRSLELQVTSLEEYGCKNVSIPYEIQQTLYNIDVNLLGIAIPEDCVSGNAPAFANIPLSNLQSNYYRFGMRLRDVVENEGTLTASDEKYHLEIADTKGIVFLNKTLMRVPPATLWGYVAFENAANSTAAVEFKNSLEALITPYIPVEGDYGYYAIDQLGRVTLAETVLLPVQFTFIYKNDQSSSGEIQQLLETYRSSNAEIIFKVFTSSGEEF